LGGGADLIGPKILKVKGGKKKKKPQY
jgi:hypothetical protein